MPHSIILFDGDCGLCNRAVVFIAKRDPQRIFHFASLQSESGRRILAKANEAAGLDTLVLVRDTAVMVRSTAVLTIAGQLTGAWRLARFLLVVPRPFRDAVYDLVARYRRRLFPLRDRCELSVDLQGRIIETDP